MRLLFPILLAASCLTVTAQAQNRKYQIAPGLTAQITHNPGSPTISVAMPGVELITLDLTQPAATTFTIKTSDYNFDGYRDFAFVGVNQTSGIQVYDIFLYHPEDKSFEILEVPGGICEAFGNVRAIAGDKTLRTSCRTGGKTSMDIYRWASPFALERVKSVDNSTEAQQDAADEKADRKAEKAEQRQDKKERIQEKKEEDED